MSIRSRGCDTNDMFVRGSGAPGAETGVLAPRVGGANVPPGVKNGEGPVNGPGPGRLKKGIVGDGPGAPTPLRLMGREKPDFVFV